MMGGRIRGGCGWSRERLRGERGAQEKLRREKCSRCGEKCGQRSRGSAGPAAHEGVGPVSRFGAVRGFRLLQYEGSHRNRLLLIRQQNTASVPHPFPRFLGIWVGKRATVELPNQLRQNAARRAAIYCRSLY
jgi:hypothetical protein